MCSRQLGASLDTMQCFLNAIILVVVKSLMTSRGSRIKFRRVLCVTLEWPWFWHMHPTRILTNRQQHIPTQASEETVAGEINHSVNGKQPAEQSSPS